MKRRLYLCSDIYPQKLKLMSTFMKRSPKRLNVIDLELNTLRISIIMIVLLVLPMRDNYGNGYGKVRADFLTSILDAENAPKFCYDMMNIANDDSISVLVNDTLFLPPPYKNSVSLTNTEIESSFAIFIIS